MYILGKSGKENIWEEDTAFEKTSIIIVSM